MNVFEFVNVVVHEKHLQKIKSFIPKKVGIVIYKFNGEHMTFEPVREPKENNTKKLMQLEILNSNDLEYIIKNKIKESHIPNYKNERLKIVKKSFNKDEFNVVFKETIKYRQSKKWKHIKDNFDMLKPIELQDAYTYEFVIR